MASPDDAAHPLFRAAPYWEAVLRAGQALWLPRGVWHAVTAETVSVSVSWWW